MFKEKPRSTCREKFKMSKDISDKHFEEIKNAAWKK